MGKVISTVRAVTTDEPGGRFGLTVSSMSSVTIEPPSMLVCIHGGSPVVAAVERNRTLCVNRLGEGQVHISEAERTMLLNGVRRVVWLAQHCLERQLRLASCPLNRRHRDSEKQGQSRLDYGISKFTTD
jgi:Flavin reductase like domain